MAPKRKNTAAPPKRRSNRKRGPTQPVSGAAQPIPGEQSSTVTIGEHVPLPNPVTIASTSVTVQPPLCTPLVYSTSQMPTYSYPTVLSVNWQLPVPPNLSQVSMGFQGSQIQLW